MGTRIKVKYFNSIVLRKLVQKQIIRGFPPNQTGSWPGLPWNPSFINSEGNTVTYPTFPWRGGDEETRAEENVNWYLEESRIKGGFNNSIMELGVRAYAVNKNREQSDRASSLIFSGVFNDRTNVNNTNVFSISENIIKDANPHNGSIQKLYSEDTNLMIFQENKVNKALINKNTIYSGEQGAEEVTGQSNVIGQLVPYLGEYGISRNPESFAMYGFRKYFVDKDRSAVLRLSRDGITEISSYGMRNYFRKQLATLNDNLTRREVLKELTLSPGNYTNITLPDVSGIDIGAQVQVIYDNGSIDTLTQTVINIPSSTQITLSSSYTVKITLGTVTGLYFVTYLRDKVYGGFDTHNKNYTLSMQTSPRNISELIEDKEEREETFDTLSFDENITGWTSFYSYQPIFINSLKNNFYTFINDEIYQHYANIGRNNYCKFYRNATPDEASVKLVFNPNPSVKKNFNTISYEGDNGWEVESIESGKQGFDSGIQYQDDSNSIKSYKEGAYIVNGVTLQAGFDRKENRYVANIVNASAPRPGEIIFGAGMSGVKGYFTTVKFKVDSSTDVGGVKELFTASANYVMSSY